MQGSFWKSLGNCVLLGAVVVAVGLAVLLVIVKANEKKGGEEVENNSELGESHPDGEVLMLKFRELFDYEAPMPVGGGTGGAGITPIVISATNDKPIDLGELLALAEKLDRSVEDLADGSTRVEQAVAWFQYKGRLHYMILLRPFERGAHELMRRPGEDLFISFLDAEGERALPASAPEQIATRRLRVAVMGAQRAAAGWVTYGELPMEGASGEGIAKPKVGWIFSSNLHGRLRQLQRGRILRDEAIHDPFQLDVGASRTTAP